MHYKSLKACLNDLEQTGQLVRIKEEVDPYLEAAAIHLRIFENKGPAILFENLKGSQFPAVSNIFGTLERSKFIFRNTLESVKTMVKLRANPMEALKHPISYFGTGISAIKALPMQVSTGPALYREIKISDIPPIVNWPMDGGPFVTLPIVYTEDPENSGIMKANMGMYRIQLSGNEYDLNQEIGLHYQLHRGIGVHQTKANEMGKPLKVSIFVGGPPSHSVAAVMPLPEGVSEATFAGALGGRRFRYAYRDGFAISTDADFVITGEVFPNQNKPEGPFGDHLGYYSLQHAFPMMKVHKVWCRKDAIWPFTVVGRPPQEDTSFGELIHEIVGGGISAEIPGLKQIHAVDAAGVHPLLLAVGSERYTPYLALQQPQEILTIANHILGTGQLSLAKFLFIVAESDENRIDANDIPAFFQHFLQRFQPERDIHFHTKTSIDTLDYSGDGLNTGSKVVFACAGDKIRELATEITTDLVLPNGYSLPKVVLPGILAIQGLKYSNTNAEKEYLDLNNALSPIGKKLQQQFPFIILCDDSSFVAKNLNNFLWVTFTRSNPAHDIQGIDTKLVNKHWICNGSVIIDARIKPHHAPVLEKVPDVERRVDKLATKGASLYGLI
jgi:4-hydroxy-3-polyprenylbenzoate decarboxylase